MTRRDFQDRLTSVIAPLVWLALVQIWVLALLGASPVMHECFHPDAHETGHHCLATDVRDGLIDPAVVVAAVAPSWLPVGGQLVVLARAGWHALPHHLCGSLLEHGPPALA